MKLDIEVPNKANKKAKVYLDGFLIKNCVYADEELGYVKVHVRGDSGFVTENDEIVEFRLEGVVRIEV